MALFACFMFELRRKSKNTDRIRDVEGGDHDLDDHGNTSTRGAKRFSWDEVERMTTSFSVVIGYGGFSTVYLARFSDSSMGAVKINYNSELLNQAYKQELEILLSISHHNIVKLLGYCSDREEGILVMEYVPNGNLQEKLHGIEGSKERKGHELSWKKRMAIAFQLAQALEYLHDKCSLQIVHGDIKASNILLDEKMNCKLCDFGSAKMGFSSTVLPPSSFGRKQMMLGSPGYTDPHYLRTGLASKKNDVYSFGVIVLELITGNEAFCSTSGERLTKICEPVLVDVEKVADTVDPCLAGKFDLEEAKSMASLAARCLGNSPSFRPSASDILTTMRSSVPSIAFLSSAEKCSEKFT